MTAPAALSAAMAASKRASTSGRKPAIWRSTPMRTPRRPVLAAVASRPQLKQAAFCAAGSAFVAASAASGAASASSSSAASMTLRVIGPAVSWLNAIGMMPLRDTRPIVGFRPTRPVTLLGQTMEPSVSLPTPIAARFAAIAAPVPELEPQALRAVS